MMVKDMLVLSMLVVMKNLSKSCSIQAQISWLSPVIFVMIQSSGRSSKMFQFSTPQHLATFTAARTIESANLLLTKAKLQKQPNLFQAQMMRSWIMVLPNFRANCIRIVHALIKIKLVALIKSFWHSTKQMGSMTLTAF